MESAVRLALSSWRQWAPRAFWGLVLAWLIYKYVTRQAISTSTSSRTVTSREASIAKADASLFKEAAAYVASAMSGSGSVDVKRALGEMQLELYGLYKQSTQGPCKMKQPAKFDLVGRSKWTAWSNLQDMTKDEARKRYVATVTQAAPNWKDGAADNQQPLQRRTEATGFGPVFSSLSGAEEPEDSAGASELWVLAGKGDIAIVEELLKSGAAVNDTDESGSSALHFAADRGHAQMAELLLKHGADIDAQDSDGQTALHYAITCGQRAVASLLVSHGAATKLPDHDGKTAAQLKPADWTEW
eukprot:jgi/Chlat1/4863/Chrsp31S04891